MAEQYKAPRGTQDILPENSGVWEWIEQTLFNTASDYGFSEIRTPIFEHTEVFSRGVGDTTDVVQKEMYTFNDKGNRSITLRPEMTAGTVRAVVEHGIINGTLPVKVCYTGPCFRYEKPQAGRLREFHQFGVECFGTDNPASDAEVILLANSALKNLGLNNLSLEINSIGCPNCRKNYHKALIEYFSSRQSELCETCRDRLMRNPMRIFDCKSPICAGICKNAPLMINYLCDECREHFDDVKLHLDSAGLKYTVNPKIVRGLDYYTKTVFEFISGDIGAQSTVCGGGRYDGLVEQLGGPHTPALGFAMGIERLILVLQNMGSEFIPECPTDIYLGSLGKEASVYATHIADLLRKDGFSVETDIVGRSAKAQMKYANKIGAMWSLMLGENELNTKTAVLRNMQTGESKEVTLPDGLFSAIYDSEIDDALQKLTDSVEETDSFLKDIKKGD